MLLGCVGMGLGSHSPTGTGLGKGCKEEQERLLQVHQPEKESLSGHSPLSEQYRQAGNNR